MAISEQILLSTAETIVLKLQQNGFLAYFVGGCVRDKLMGHHLEDVDIATSALPNQIKQLFPKTYDIGAAFGVINVVEQGINYEVATFRREDKYMDGRRPERIIYSDSPEEDASRRDFTINAIFYDPVKKEVLDYYNGIEDLRKGVIKCIGNAEKRLNEDYLRILRAIRFGVRFGFKIDSEIFEVIKNYKENLKKLSSERIRDELNKIFAGPRADLALDILSETGVLKVVLPEIEFLKGVEQPAEFHPEGDVFQHVKLMLSKMAAPSVELVWAVLLHDVGKPETFHIDENGRQRFFCHEAVGAKIAEDVMRRLKFSNQIRKRVCAAVKQHMRFANVIDMKKAKWQRIIMADTFSLELELHRLDVLCSNKNFAVFLFLLDRLMELNERPFAVTPFVNGSDLIKLGLKPGPVIGKALRALMDLQISGEITNKAEALKYLNKKYFS